MELPAALLGGRALDPLHHRVGVAAAAPVGAGDEVVLAGGALRVDALCNRLRAPVLRA